MTSGERTLELTLRWEGGRWRASGTGVDVSHADLAGLDRLILRALAGTSGAARACVRFDIRSLPAWLRQYQAHYFNYVLRIDGGERA